VNILIKKLLAHQSVDINKILLNNYAKLGLNEEETVSLMHLFSLYEKGKNALSYGTIKNKMSLSQKQVSGVLNSLVSKGFIDIRMETSKNGREQQCFDLMPVLMKIEQIFINSIEEEKKANMLKLISSYIELFERELGRSLSPVEIGMAEQIASKFNLNEVKEALIEAANMGKINLKQIITILNTNEIAEEEVDEEHAKAIRDFYSRINK